ncbi:hypothetical protein BDR04DRAFT_450113 [Suillus decipiens]|nr:hypothetical protein BDR04DRAFT_450113 [Suillus decipiens]
MFCPCALLRLCMPVAFDGLCCSCQHLTCTPASPEETVRFVYASLYGNTPATVASMLLAKSLFHSTDLRPYFMRSESSHPRMAFVHMKQ